MVNENIASNLLTKRIKKKTFVLKKDFTLIKKMIVYFYTALFIINLWT
uniref:Uncharacterized protein n=1 Tax=viral metagenome TaxID=1070528 RepID=A0A6C0IW80_9ZZZZ